MKNEKRKTEYAFPAHPLPVKAFRYVRIFSKGGAFDLFHPGRKKSFLSHQF
jgi:hypothetical protein